jgi:hypothetical protein
MFGWVEDVRSFRGGGSTRVSEWVQGVRTFSREQAARLLGWGGVEVEKRAKLLSRMIALIVHGLRTKSYDQFVATFSNPGQEPDVLKRLSHKANFQMRISPTCWYDAEVSYARDKSRKLRIVGGGDDFGVLIIPNALKDDIRVEFNAEYGERPGRDAFAMVKALSKLPGYRRVHSDDVVLEI